MWYCSMLHGIEYGKDEMKTKDEIEDQENEPLRCNHRSGLVVELR